MREYAAASCPWPALESGESYVGFAPTRVTVRVRGEALVGAPGDDRSRPVKVGAGHRELASDVGGLGMPANASGGGHDGPLAYRQGKPMRPDVALAFDRLAAARREAGLCLIVTSCYRSDAEQARLFAAHLAGCTAGTSPPGASLAAGSFNRVLRGQEGAVT